METASIMPDQPDEGPLLYIDSSAVDVEILRENAGDIAYMAKLLVGELDDSLIDVGEVQSLIDGLGDAALSLDASELQSTALGALARLGVQDIEPAA